MRLLSFRVKSQNGLTVHQFLLRLKNWHLLSFSAEISSTNAAPAIGGCVIWNEIKMQVGSRYTGSHPTISRYWKIRMMQAWIQNGANLVPKFLLLYQNRLTIVCHPMKNWYHIVQAIDSTKICSFLPFCVKRSNKMVFE